MEMARLDHVVIVVRALDQAIADFQAMGFTTTPGGVHADGLTANALVPFADGTYLELIAFRAPDVPQAHRWYPRLAAGEGFADAAIVVDNLSEAAEDWRRRGLRGTGPVDGGRQRLDGQELRWRTFFFDRDQGLPFAIEDVTARASRVPGGAAAVHANGAVGITALHVVGPPAMAQAYRDLCDQPLASNRFNLGAQTIVLDAASPADVPALSALLWVPTMVVLQGSSSDQMRISPASHGARFTWASGNL